MSLGELTGEFFNMTEIDRGMPFRSTYVMRDDKRKNYSVIDNELNNVTDIEEVDFQYFDPTLTNFGTSNIVGHGVARSRHMNMNDSGRNQMTFMNTDYMNNIFFNIFTNIQEKTKLDFCIFPIGILKTLVANDPTIDSILQMSNTKEIFHQIKTQKNNIISRASAIISTPYEYVKNKLTYYENNDNCCIEFPMSNDKFSFGIICNKNKDDIILTKKVYNEYILNLHRANINVFCPAFKAGNKLNLNKIVNELGFVNRKNSAYNYYQNVLFELNTDIYLKTSAHNPIIDLTENIIYYVRFVPSNILLFIGKKTN